MSTKVSCMTCPDLRALQDYLRRQEEEEAASLADMLVPCSSASGSGSRENTIGIQIGNTCVPAEKDGYFNWTLFVHGDGTYELNDRIKSVTVTLHPSFRNNVVVLENAPFELTRCGWGTFRILIDVEVYTNSTRTKTTTLTLDPHMLSFEPGGFRRNEVLQLPGTTSPAPSPKPKPKLKLSANQKGNLRDDLIKEVGGSPEEIVRSMHGTHGDASWEAPVKVVHCDVEARPGYASRKAHEYNDTPRVLRAKVALLAHMVRTSRQMAAYTGAGISTASGIGDYASKAKDTTCGKTKKVGGKSSMQADPTLAHRVLAAMHTAGYLKHWVQQNHDGLPQKAGFPQYCLNEIHGAWQDPSNPVVPMDGHLRGDLIKWMAEWETKADLCLVLGTSMCGMAADDFALTVNEESHAAGNGLGMVVVSLQQTQHDSKAALRIFAKIDAVMALLAEELSKDDVVTAPSTGGGATMATRSQPKTAPKRGPLLVKPYEQFKPLAGPYDSVFHVPYRANGKKASTGNKKRMVLDLRPGAAIKVTRGVGAGFVGAVRGVTETGDFALTLPLQRENHPRRGKKMSVYILGRWWVQDAIDGNAMYLPVVNVEPVFKTAK